MLVADAHGAVLHGATADEFAQASGDVSAAVQAGARQLAPDLLAGEIVLAANAHTLAVTSPYTHAIRLLPLP